MWSYFKRRSNSRRGTGSRQGDKVKKVWLRILVPVSLLLVLAISGCEADGFEAGVEAFNQGDYATPLNTFRPLAEQGEAQALFKLRVVWECPAGPFAESQDPGSPNS